MGTSAVENWDTSGRKRNQRQISQFLVPMLTMLIIGLWCSPILGIL